MKRIALIAVALSSVAFAGPSYNGLRQNGGANNGSRFNHIEPNGTGLTGHKVESTGVKARNATARGGRLFIR